MLKMTLAKMMKVVKDFLKEIYYAELDNIDNFYKQYRERR